MMFLLGTIHPRGCDMPDMGCIIIAGYLFALAGNYNTYRECIQ